MSRNLQCTKVSDLPGYEQAKLWWRSRTPEEKKAVLSTQGYLFFPTIVITVPVPLQGYITIKRTNDGYENEVTVLLGTKQIERMRIFYKKCNQKGWTVRSGKGSVIFTRPGRVVCTWRSAAERFLWT